MATEYTGTWNMKDVYRGDTIKAFAITITDVDNATPIIPMGVCCQMRDSRDNVLYQYNPTTDVVTGRVSFEKVDTRGFSTGLVKFDIEYTLQDSTVRTYVSGKVRILEDISRCRT